MENLRTLFLKRLELSANMEVTFQSLNKILESIAYNVPFENLAIIENRTKKITKNNLVEKILVKKEGGLCYELNPFFYLFLKEVGFSAKLVRGSVYNQRLQDWSPTGITHVANIISYNGEQYLVDVGFGGSIPLTPVPFNGKTVVSKNGEFRIVPTNHSYGDHILYIKIKDKDSEWRKGYVFNSKENIHDVTVFNDMQQVIMNHPESSFHKGPLITKLTENGSVTLTENSFTKWENGEMTKETIDDLRFEILKKEVFHLS